MKEILSHPQSLAKVFCRHTYGMLSWVDIFCAKLKSIDDLDMKYLTAKIIADNAKHAKLFSERAVELGEDPNVYKPPDIGQKIYDILDSLNDPFDEYAYAWGSLIHFSELLDLYISVSDPKSKHILEEVKTDVESHLVLLQKYFKSNAESDEKRHRTEEMKSNKRTGIHHHGVQLMSVLFEHKFGERVVAALVFLGLLTFVSLALGT